MAEHFLVIDAWIREAQEVSIMVEDIESRIKNKDLAQEHNRLRDNAQSKLFDVGVKLDRLESLLHNPPSKPILTKEDMEFRWKMLSDFRLRTRALALILYTKRPRDLSVANPEGISKPTNSDDQDHMKPILYKDDPEMLKPLISDEATQSRSEVKQSGFHILVSVLWKWRWIICMILGAGALLFLLVILCSGL